MMAKEEQEDFCFQFLRINKSFDIDIMRPKHVINCCGSREFSSSNGSPDKKQKIRKYVKDQK